MSVVEKPKHGPLSVTFGYAGTSGDGGTVLAPVSKPKHEAPAHADEGIGLIGPV
jgi:hypothetical protein